MKRKVAWSGADLHGMQVSIQTTDFPAGYAGTEPFTEHTLELGQGSLVLDEALATALMFAVARLDFDRAGG